jgi:hypothetical protein
MTRCFYPDGLDDCLSVKCRFERGIMDMMENRFFSRPFRRDPRPFRGRLDRLPEFINSVQELKAAVDIQLPEAGRTAIFLSTT